MNLYHSAAIFTGGKSSRMGRDKSLLPFGKEQTLAQFQYKKLTQVFDTVYLSSKDKKFDFDAKVVLDIHEEASPLVGLLSLFNTIDSDAIFILSVDAPFVDKDVIKTLLEKDTKECDVIVAKSPNGLQPLCGLYKRSVLPLLQQQYEKRNHKLKDLLDLAHTVTVAFNDDKPFTNLNHPNEYEEALALSLNLASSE